MMNKKALLNNAVFFAFLLSFIYWGCLALNSRMIIECDAVKYESLGKMLAEKGWREYFLTGPNREPLYPLMISFSVKIGVLFGVSYQRVQVILQFLILFITQLMLAYALRLLNINNLIAALTVFYLGISPAIVNSALSLYSEIITYPLILAAVLIMHQFWFSFFSRKRKTALFSIAAGLLFVLIVLSKGIFEIITPVFIALFFLSVLPMRNRGLILGVFRHAAVILFIFYAFVSGYKLTNKAFNGNFVFTNRAGIMFYGSAVRRTAPFALERLLTALAYVPGEGVCRGIFGEEKCSFWSFKKSDELAYGKFYALRNSGMDSNEADREITRIAFKEIAQAPGSFLLFCSIEGLKMFFWESTQMGFVSYPQKLAGFFSWPPLKNGLRLFVSVLTFISFIYAVIFLLRRRKEFFIKPGNPEILIFFCVFVVFVFSGFSSLCQILPRYALPMAPLYLVISAFFLQKVFFKPESVRSGRS